MWRYPSAADRARSTAGAEALAPCLSIGSAAEEPRVVRRARNIALGGTSTKSAISSARTRTLPIPRRSVPSPLDAGVPASYVRGSHSASLLLYGVKPGRAPIHAVEERGGGGAAWRPDELGGISSAATGYRVIGPAARPPARPAAIHHGDLVRQLDADRLQYAGVDGHRPGP